MIRPPCYRVPIFDPMSPMPYMGQADIFSNGKYKTYEDQTLITLDPELVFMAMGNLDIDYSRPFVKSDEQYEAYVIRVYVNKDHLWKLELLR